MSGAVPLGPIVHSFFVDHLVTVKGLRPATIRSYRDTIRLFLCFVAADKKVKITKLCLEDLSFERTLGFLRYLEEDRQQPRPHAEPALGRAAHAVRLRRQPGAGDARRLSAGRGHPRQARRARRDALPRA